MMKSACFHFYLHAHGRLSIAMLALFCAGCASLSDPSLNSVNPTLSVVEQQQLENLLIRAEDAMADSELNPPEHNRVVDLFEQALKLDPNNVRARRGLEQILEHYVEKALQAANRGDTSTARLMLRNGKQIDPQHPSIAPTAQFVQNVDTSHREAVTLRGLSKRRLRQTIDGLVLGTKGNCRFRIFAASDARTRALYQLLRESFAQNRIEKRPRAVTEISTPERMERVCNYDNK